MPKNNGDKLLSALILFTSSSFIILYIWAANNYKGGNSFESNSLSFLWSKNYFCDLFQQTNLSRSLGIAALTALTVSIYLFFIRFSRISKPIQKTAIRLSALFSMICLNFVYTSAHDFLIILAVFFGSIAFTILTFEIFRKREKHNILSLFLLGVLISTYLLIYYLNLLEQIHPLLQKAIILYALVWINFPRKKNYKA